MLPRARPLPASLRFVLALLGLGVCGALASGIMQHEETTLQVRRAAEAMTRGQVAAGKRAIIAHGCDACHVIPGIPTATGQVGPSLRGIARRAIIAGNQPGDPQHMMAWIAAPEHLSPDTTMPDQLLTPQDTRNVAAYLYTLQ